MNPEVSPRARAVVLGVLAVMTLGLIVAAAVVEHDRDEDRSADVDGGDTDSPAMTTPSTSTVPKRQRRATTTTAPPATFPLAADDGVASDERRLVEAFEVSDDDLQPKSVVASGDGVVVAQNMMYRHNVSMFDRAGTKLASIHDTVDLADFGIEDGATVQGSPVEAAFMPDGRHVYVSNYKMYGSGYNPIADDNCDRGSWDDSFVYRIDVKKQRIDRVIPTGAVPKFLAVTPDGRRLLVSNWCGFDVSVIDTTDNTELTRIDVGRHPRGIAITSDSSAAYVAVMGEARIVKIDIAAASVVGEVGNAGQSPRHLVLSPDNRYLYVTNNLEGNIRKIDLSTGVLLARLATGTQPRSMAIAEDGESLYVVNYQDGTVSKVRASDMTVLQTLPTGFHPVGITYDPASRQVWVANYAGSLSVFVDKAQT